MMARLHPIALGLALQASAAGAPDVGAAPAENALQAAETRAVAETTGGPVVRQRAGARASRSTAKSRPAARRGRARVVKSAPAAEAAEPPVTVLALTPEQRETIYRTVLREQQVPAPVAEPAPSARVIAGPLASGQIITARPPVIDRTVPAVPDAPQPAGGAARARAVVSSNEMKSFPVGAQLPETVPLYAIPEHVTVRMPQMRAYSYALLDRRVLLVEPMTSRVVAEIDP